MLIALFGAVLSSSKVTGLSEDAINCIDSWERFFAPYSLQLKHLTKDMLQLIQLALLNTSNDVNDLHNFLLSNKTEHKIQILNILFDYHCAHNYRREIHIYLFFNFAAIAAFCAPTYDIYSKDSKLNYINSLSIVILAALKSNLISIYQVFISLINLCRCDWGNVICEVDSNSFQIIQKLFTYKKYFELKITERQEYKNKRDSYEDFLNSCHIKETKQKFIDPAF